MHISLSFFIAGFIDKNCWAGLDEYFSSLMKALSVECEESSAVTGGLKRKTKRKRRVTAVGGGLQTITPDILVSNHPAVAADLPRSHSNIAIKLLKNLHKIVFNINQIE